MCIAAVTSNYSNSRRTSYSTATTTTKSSVVRFAMKLPCYNPHPTSSAAAGALLRGRDDHEVGLNVDGSGSAELRNTRTGSSSTGVRRCQSANAGSRRARTSFIPNTNMMTKSRSHSQEPTSSSNLLRRTKPTELLPIPPSATNDNGHARPDDGNGVGGLARSVDKTDLTRMYDYATWNMYERIVSARRRRLSAIDTQSSEASSTAPSSRSTSDDGQHPQQANGVNKGGQSTAVNAVTNVPTFKSTQQSKLLNKTSSTDDSTLATSDETDKSSTTSSSWSRTDSPGTCPTMAVSTMPSFPHIGRPSSCPPSSGREDSDDHFIFELDM